MIVKKINIYALKKQNYLSPIRCDNFSEAATVCLDHCQHLQNVLLTVEGDLKAQFELAWEQASQSAIDSRSNLVETVEDGASCLAILVIEELTGYQVIRQTPKGTGVDFLLGTKEGDQYYSCARLEISGILKGSPAQIQQRIKQKVEQSTQSDHFDIPVFIVVVEFSQPQISILKR
ncbi:MAG: hypothetical protein EAZ97_06710 [Bacteroidetes bacterium]|nr:MAG: hypothetical protein EAZ97_06710 [Bacteroidota bacterium]